MSFDGQNNREQDLTSRYPACFLVWLAAIAFPVYIPVQNTKKPISPHKRPPLPRNGIIKLSFRIRTCHKDVDKSMQPSSDPQVIMFGHKAHSSLLQGLFFNANERGGLEEWRPILTNGIVDACLACQPMARRT